MAFATFDPAKKNSRLALSGGNLVATTDASTVAQLVAGTLTKASGKLYYEVTISAGTDATYSAGISIGLTTEASFTDGTYAGSDLGYAYSSISGQKFHNSSGAAYGASFAAGDVISVLVDFGAGTVGFWKNGVDQGTAYTGITGTLYPGVSMVPHLTPSVAASVTANFGASAFVYTPPAGYTGWSSLSAGEAAAAVTLQQLTATGSAPISPGLGVGSPSLQKLTASAVGLNGTQVGHGTLQGLTAAGVDTSSVADGQAQAGLSLEALTATGTGVTPGSAAASLQELAAAGVAQNGGVASGVGTLEELTAEAHIPNAAAASLQQLTAAATALNGGVATAAPTLRPVTAAATSTVQGTGAGAATLPSVQAYAQAHADGRAALAATLRSLQATATAIGGQAAHGAPSLKALTAVAAGYPLDGAVGKGTIPLVRADAYGETVLANTFTAWTMNTRHGGVTGYKNYGFNSLTKFGGKYYGAGPAGVFELDGANDAGADIVGTFRLGQMDDKTAALKRLPEVVLGLRSSGPLRVRVWKDDNTSFDYTLPAVKANTIHQARVKPGKGMRSRYYKVEVIGLNNAAFDIDSVQVNMVPTGRRVG